MFSIDSKASWLIGGGHHHTHRCRAGVCVVCVRGCRWTLWRCGKKITPLSIAPGTFVFSKIMNRIDDRVGTLLHSLLFIVLVTAAEWSELLIPTHRNVVLIVVIKNWTIEAANRAWRCLLSWKTQTSNYLWERASRCAINIQCVC